MGFNGHYLLTYLLKFSGAITTSQSLRPAAGVSETAHGLTRWTAIFIWVYFVPPLFAWTVLKDTLQRQRYLRIARIAPVPPYMILLHIWGQKILSSIFL